MTARSHVLRNRGFTLIELIIVIVLIGLLAAVGTSMISDSFETTYMLNSSASSSAKARNALERVERELREVKPVQPPGTGFDIPTLTTPKISFTRLDGAIVTIDFDSASETLRLCSDSACTSPITLADQVTGFTMTYSGIATDGSSIPNATSANVKFVDISMTVKDAKSGQVLAQTTRVALRNTG